MKINPYRSFANGVKVLFSGLDGLYLKSSVHTQFFLIRHGSRVINLECSVSVPNNRFFFGNTQENENYITQFPTRIFFSSKKKYMFRDFSSIQQFCKLYPFCKAFYIRYDFDTISGTHCDKMGLKISTIQTTQKEISFK